MTLLAGKYRLSRVIGQGGMGVVVAATHAQKIVSVEVPEGDNLTIKPIVQ
ncbi:MAG TPA: hypothetical protein VGH87_08250 [Polyangiaceae bacterium]